MLSHEEMIGLQAEKHDLVETEGFRSREEYVLHLIHRMAYEQASRFGGGKTVLDLGCNNGYGSQIIGRTAEKIVGVDVSENAIAAARRSYGRGNLNFELTDGGRLEFKDDTFELIVNFQVIEHVVSYHDYISEIVRVLSPGGAVMFTTPNALLRLDPGMKPWNPFHVREFSAPELKDVLCEFFEEVRVYGLFAEERLYAIEFDRLKRARENSRRRAGRRVSFWDGLRYGLRKWLPRHVKDRMTEIQGVLKRDKAPSDNGELTEEFRKRYTTDDLFYRDGDLKGALDLLAVCGTEKHVVESLDPKRE